MSAFLTIEAIDDPRISDSSLIRLDCLSVSEIWIISILYVMDTVLYKTYGKDYVNLKYPECIYYYEVEMK